MPPERLKFILVAMCAKKRAIQNIPAAVTVSQITVRVNVLFCACLGLYPFILIRAVIWGISNVFPMHPAADVLQVAAMGFCHQEFVMCMSIMTMWNVDEVLCFGSKDMIHKQKVISPRPVRVKP